MEVKLWPLAKAIPLVPSLGTASSQAQIIKDLLKLQSVSVNELFLTHRLLLNSSLLRCHLERAIDSPKNCPQSRPLPQRLVDYTSVLHEQRLLIRQIQPCRMQRMMCLLEQEWIPFLRQRPKEVVVRVWMLLFQC